MLARVNGFLPFISSESSGSKKLVPADTVVRFPPNRESCNAAHDDKTHPSTGHPIRYAYNIVSEIIQKVANSCSLIHRRFTYQQENDQPHGVKFSYHTQEEVFLWRSQTLPRSPIVCP